MPWSGTASSAALHATSQVDDRELQAQGLPASLSTVRLLLAALFHKGSEDASRRTLRERLAPSRSRISTGCKLQTSSMQLVR